MEMNKHLQSRLLDLMECRLFWSTQIDSPTSKKRKMLKVESSILEGEEEPQPSGWIVMVCNRWLLFQYFVLLYFSLLVYEEQ